MIVQVTRSGAEPMGSMPTSAQPPDEFASILERQRAILGSRQIDARALIEYQVAVSAFSSRIEIVSRVAECAVATVRRLQNGL